jgi:hypothetical protein
VKTYVLKIEILDGTLKVTTAKVNKKHPWKKRVPFIHLKKFVKKFVAQKGAS